MIVWEENPTLVHGQYRWLRISSDTPVYLMCRIERDEEEDLLYVTVFGEANTRWAVSPDFRFSSTIPYPGGDS